MDSVSVVGGLYVFAILPPSSPTKRQRWEGTSGTATDYHADDPNIHPFQTDLLNTNYLCGHFRVETVDKQLGQGDPDGGNLGL